MALYLAVFASANTKSVTSILTLSDVEALADCEASKDCPNGTSVVECKVKGSGGCKSDTDEDGKVYVECVYPDGTKARVICP